MPSDLYDKNSIDTVVHALSMQIRESLQAQEAQRHFPDSNADAMDAKIKFAGTRVAVLRDLRERYENEMARPLQNSDGTFR